MTRLLIVAAGAHRTLGRVSCPARASCQKQNRPSSPPQLTWSDCQRVGEEIVALRIKGKGSVFQDVPVPGRLSAALLEWKAVQEKFKGRRIMAPGGIAFAASQFVFAGYSGAPFSNRAFNLRLRAGCRALGEGRSPRMGCATPRP